MARISLIVRYDGTAYLGWQKTGEGPSIEGALNQALAPLVKEKIVLEAASRTDAGVHALGQVVCFSITEQIPLSLHSLQRALNATLPADIRVLTIEERSSDFHPTLDAVKKEYLYVIANTPYQLPFDRNFTWHYPHPLCVEAMQKAGSALLGTHDFSALCNEKSALIKNPICSLEKISVNKTEENKILLTYMGNRFLYKMVRNLTGLLVTAGLGKILPGQIPSLVDSRDRTRLPVTAPASGLYLKKVYYL